MTSENQAQEPAMAQAPVQAGEELELNCPRGGSAVVELRYHSGQGELEVTCCSRFPDGTIACSQPCVKH